MVASSKWNKFCWYFILIFSRLMDIPEGIVGFNYSKKRKCLYEKLGLEQKILQTRLIYTPTGIQCLEINTLLQQYFPEEQFLHIKDIY